MLHSRTDQIHVQQYDWCCQMSGYDSNAFSSCGGGGWQHMYFYQHSHEPLWLCYRGHQFVYQVLAIVVLCDGGFNTDMGSE